MCGLARRPREPEGTGRMTICPVILCGGEGSRLWPVSRRDLPKQFIPLADALSSFQQACLRLAGMKDAGAPIVVTGAAHEAVVLRQLAEIGTEAVVLIEPEGRDSGPAVAAAAIYLNEIAPGTIAVVQPADHFIPELESFRAAAALAVAGAGTGVIGTFGIAPAFPGTAYGYIAAGDPLDGVPGVARVRQFVEKPSREKAIEYLARGYVWNSGIFVFRPDVFLAELAAFEPEIADAARDAVREAVREGIVVRLGASAFRRAPKRSVDHAVMEHTKKAAVVKGDFKWSDLGAWDAVYEVLPKDGAGNSAWGDNVILVDSEKCFVRAPHTPVVVIGLKDVGVIVERDAVLVCHLNATHSVKSAVETLKARARPEGTRRASPPLFRHDLGDLKSASRQLDRWLEGTALPLWWSVGADHEQGGFFELLDDHPRPVRTKRRLRVQARQAWTYVEAGMAGWQGPSRVAAVWAFDYLEAHYRRPDGLYRKLVNDDGSVADDGVTLYDQAFMMLAFAAAAKTRAGLAQMLRPARAILDVLNTDHRHALGGFREELKHGAALQANPHMHLLEAALAWMEAGGGREWAGLADTSVRLAREYFIDPATGSLREFFDDTGLPIAGPAGRIVEPGHQFEWAHLLVRWAGLRGDTSILAAARQLYEIGARHGIDPIRRVAVDALWDDLRTMSAEARLWPQTEWAKAALAMAKIAEGADERAALERDALAALHALVQYLDATIAGLWRDKLRPDGTFVDEPSPASSLYHIAGVILALRAYVT
jgi:mannose-1-phosphate guanylyltransferase / mannose-6-phosphate isomerase